MQAIHAATAGRLAGLAPRTLAPAGSSFKAGAALAAPSLGTAPRARAALRVWAFKEGEEQQATKQATPGVSADKGVPAFTRRREHFVGRVASLGMAADIVGEIVTGLGPIHQLSKETGFPPMALFAALALLLATNFFGGVSPYSDTFSERNQADVSRRPPDLGFNPNPRKFLGEAEVNIGRAAMVGFLTAVAVEFLSGGAAPLVRLGVLPPGGGTLATAGFGLTALVALFAANGFGAFSIFGDYTGRDEDIY